MWVTIGQHKFFTAAKFPLSANNSRYTPTMSALDSPFIVGHSPPRDGPLARFLPPLEDGLAAEWLPPRASTGSWLLDPFGVAPRLAVEAARAGYRVLVTAHNPIARFLLEMTAAPPAESDLKAALADLAVTKKGDERLETHLQSLYITKCNNCGQEIPARAFLWKKGEEAPFARRYTCPACEDSGERPVTEFDVEQARKTAEAAGMHRARLLERVARPGDPDREFVEEALAVYQPRAIYALATLINRLDAPGVSPERRRALSALFLSACDAANNLWRVDNERPRPKQLTVSNEFRENNIWMALEAAVDEWRALGESVPIVQWPNKIPESGGIIRFEGRIADLASIVNEAPIAAVVTALPRPNQAYWTLCALWAGWLWGSESAEPFHLVLRRRRYDWGWHLEALQAALHHLFELLKLGTPCLALLPEPEPAFLTAALAAGDLNGFHLEGLAMRTQHDAAQITWTRGERLRHAFADADADSVRAAIRGHLSARGEPTFYLPLHAAALSTLTADHALARPHQPTDEVIREAAKFVQETLLGDESLVRYRGGESADTGLWGLSREIEAAEPLSDRVEVGIVNFLLAHPNCTFEEILHDVSSGLPGLLAPSLAIVGEALVSYAEQAEGRWRLREEDVPSARKFELIQIGDMLQSIGEKLDYRTNRLDERTLVWEAGETSAYVFHLRASAIPGPALTESPYPRERCLIVLPGGRASLLSYKLNRDPALAARLEGVRVVKFRTVRALASRPVLNQQDFEAQIAGDPAQQARGQLKLF
ncbi:MAG: hypothetical protein C4583_13805 [Anaerolineaceae bacterium]|nr:MAG: hypothetical protein C4583_13805 [Anaerolineaceae bacterium]